MFHVKHKENNMGKETMRDQYKMIKQRADLCYEHDIDDKHYEYYSFKDTHITVIKIKDTTVITEIRQRM